MVFGIKRRIRMRRLAWGSTPRAIRKKNQLQRAKGEFLEEHARNPTQSEILQSLKSRAAGAKEAFRRLEQLRAVKKNLARNPGIVLDLLELAANEKDPTEQKKIIAIAAVLSDSRPGEETKEYIRGIARAMKHPKTRTQVLADLKKGITPQIKQLLERADELRQDKPEK